MKFGKHSVIAGALLLTIFVNEGECVKITAVHDKMTPGIAMTTGGSWWASVEIYNNQENEIEIESIFWKLMDNDLFFDDLITWKWTYPGTSLLPSERIELQMGWLYVSEPQLDAALDEWFEIGLQPFTGVYVFARDKNTDEGTYDNAVTPEPSTLLLLGSGLAGFFWFERKKLRMKT